MKRTWRVPSACVVALAWAAVGNGAEPTEPFLRNLPPGVFLKSSAEVPADQTAAIGKKLGGQIERLTNSQLQVHGRAIGVNAITGADEAAAQAIHDALLRIKPYPFCRKKDRVVIEFVGPDVDVALATKTSYELGLVEKPSQVRYRVIAELATVDTADDMASNPLFNQFLALRKGPTDDVLRQIDELSKKFTFGQSLVLRNPRIGNEAATHQFQPAATGADEDGASVRYSFGQRPLRQGVPYVTATLEITVDHTGLRASGDPPAKGLTAATPFWPADDPQFQALARQITQGKSNDGAKALAILQWLAPGKNLRYSGQTGSRWGAAKVLQQKSGHCWDFADCFVTLCRAAGVPSRQVAGWFYGSSGHVWAEFYREGKGWQQVDPTGGGALRCGIYHIPYFTSEDGPMPILYLALPIVEVVPAN